MIKAIFISLAAVVLVGCDYSYSVRRWAKSPDSIDPGVVREVLKQQAGYNHRFDFCCEKWMRAIINRGDANVHVGIEDGYIDFSSGWVNRLPDVSVLEQSLQMQIDLIRILKERFRDLPNESDYKLEWHPPCFMYHLTSSTNEVSPVDANKE